MKADVIHGRSFRDDLELRRVIGGYIDFYNERRVHSSLDYVSPTRYEQTLAHRGVY